MREQQVRRDEEGRALTCRERRAGILLGFNHGRQLSTTQPLAHSPRLDEGENQKCESTRTHGLRKDSLLGKAIATWAEKAKQGLHSLLPIGR